MTPKTSSQNLHTQRNIHFSENPKILKFKNLNPKNGPSIPLYENIRESHPGYDTSYFNIQHVGVQGIFFFVLTRVFARFQQSCTLEALLQLFWNRTGSLS